MAKTKQAKDVAVGDIITTHNGSKLKVEEVRHFGDINSGEVWLFAEGREEPVVAEPSYTYEVRR